MRQDLICPVPSAADHPRTPRCSINIRVLRNQIQPGRSLWTDAPCCQHEENTHCGKARPMPVLSFNLPHSVVKDQRLVHLPEESHSEQEAGAGLERVLFTH